jgi:hypothetical protein
LVKFQKYFPEFFSEQEGQWAAENVREAIDLFSVAIRKHVAEEKKEEDFFEFIGQIMIPTTTEDFIAKNRFVVDTSKNASVKISYVGENFQKRYLQITEKPFSGSTLIGRRLINCVLDEKIIAEIGGEVKAVTTLAEIYGAISKQPKGKKGKLFTNGFAM